MCGICGFVGDADPVATSAMLQRLSHRGPDDAGEWTAPAGRGRVWFGHRRLSILDLSAAAHQPMVARDGQLALTFNGEIYNFAEIKAELVRAGYPFVGSGDTEVLLAAWQHWGAAAVDRLRGMFAFAVWDARTQSLWLVRDRMGEKPLYYAEVGGTLFFASELRALLASDKIPRTLDPAGLESYLAFGAVSQPDTLVRGVRMLEAGHILQYHAGRVQSRAYWSVPQEGAMVDRDEAVAAVRAAVDESIELCMVSDVPVGLLLSGGVDSTAILARLCARGHRNTSTFSVGFEGAGSELSESAWAGQTAAHFGTDHREILISARVAADLLPRALTAVDLPSVDGFNHYLVFHAISQAGFKVAITGQGADELFFGYARHASYAAVRRLAAMRAPALVRSAANRTFDVIASGSRWPAKGVSLLGSGTPDRLAYVARHTVFTSDEIVALRGRGAASAADYVPEVSGDSPLARLYRTELLHCLRNQLLRDGDQMSMSRSLELRAPFVDHRLVELVSSLPTSVKMTPRRQKALLVDAVNDDRVRLAAQRPKSGFPFPLRRWVTEGMDRRPFSPDMFGLCPQRVKEVVERGIRGRGFSQYWALVVLADWMESTGVHAA